MDIQVWIFRLSRPWRAGLGGVRKSIAALAAAAAAIRCAAVVVVASAAAKAAATPRAEAEQQKPAKTSEKHSHAQ